MEFLYGSLDLSTFLLDLKMYIRRTQVCDQIHEGLCDTPKCHGLLWDMLFAKKRSEQV